MPPICVSVSRQWLALLVQLVLLSNILPEIMTKPLYRVVRSLSFRKTRLVVVLFVLVGLHSLPVARPFKLLSSVAFSWGKRIALKRSGYLRALNRPVVCTPWRPLIWVTYLVLYIRTAVRQHCGKL